MDRKIGLSSRAGSFERLVAPGKPVDRIVGVLQQIRAALLRQTIGHVSILTGYPYGRKPPPEAVAL